ncbi:hypothetical protein Scep_003919 [Stephania cephalantha]|uniref:Uncharacterized protein n=1 Tax=Stephania cephalantha TaxID=152367 RepID=A0AAP0PW74_9MAGN
MKREREKERPKEKETELEEVTQRALKGRTRALGHAFRIVEGSARLGQACELDYIVSIAREMRGSWGHGSTGVPALTTTLARHTSYETQGGRQA